MDFDLTGKRAVICASSTGLGFACARALAEEGCSIVINGRHKDRLKAAAEQIAASIGKAPGIIVGDLDTPDGRLALLAGPSPIDILITNNGGPAPGVLGEWSHADWLSALESNLLSAVHLIEAVLPGMRARKFGRIVNITSAMVKTPKLPMALSTTARAGLTAFTRALAGEIAADNVTINNLLPEKIATARLESMIAETCRRTGLSEADARSRFLKSVPAGRFGKPEELAAACAFLCSRQAAYITGQNISIDGGAYRGLI